MESSRKIAQDPVLFLVPAFEDFQPVRYWSLSLANFMQENALNLPRSEFVYINESFQEVDLTRSIGLFWRIAE